MKKTLLTIITIFLLVFSINLVLAKSVEVAEVPVYFVTHMTANQNYYKNLDISNIYDKELLSFEVIIKADFEPNTEIKVHLEDSDYNNDYWCLPNVWTTPNATVHNYEASFDCTGFFDSKKVANKKVIIIFKTSKTANNVRPRVKYVYYNPDKSDLNIMGTYYEVGDNAKVIAQLSQNGIGVNNASCFASIYYPDNTIFLRNVFMHNITDSDGFYVYDIKIPNTTGVYPISVVCDYNTKLKTYLVGNEIINKGTSVNGGYSILFKDGNYSIIIPERTNDSYVFDVDIFFYNVTIFNNNIKEFFVEWNGYTDFINSTCYLYWYDWINNTWIDSDNHFDSLLNDISFKPINIDNISHLVNNGTIKIKINGTTQLEYINNQIFFDGFEDGTLQPFYDMHLSPYVSVYMYSGSFLNGVYDAYLTGTANAGTRGDGAIAVNISTINHTNITISYVRQTSGAESNDCFKVEASYDNGTSWVTLENWCGNNGPSTKTFTLSSSFNNKNNIIIRWLANLNYDNDFFDIDDVKVTGMKIKDNKLYTDLLHLNGIETLGVVNQVRGGGEFNVKNRLSRVEEKINNISTSFYVNETQIYKINFMQVESFNVNDKKFIYLSVENYYNPMIKISNVNCSYSIYDVYNFNSTSYNYIIEDEKMTNLNNGFFFSLINDSYMNETGIYTVEVVCSNDVRLMSDMLIKVVNNSNINNNIINLLNQIINISTNNSNDLSYINKTLSNDIINLLNYINQTTTNTSNLLNIINNKITTNQNYLLNILNNQSMNYNKLIELQNNITNNYNELKNIENMIINTNSSIISKVNKNYNLLLLMNNTINQILGEIINNVESHLNNISSNLSIINNDLQIIINNTDEVEGNQQIIISILQNINSSINKINNTIINVNNNLESMNLTINNKLNNITNQLVFINQTTTNIYDILNCNYVNNVICNKLDSIQGNVSLLVNQTNYISNYLNGTITDYLININQTQHNIFDYLINNISVSINDNKNLLLSVLTNQAICYNKLLEIQNNVTTNYYELQFVKAMIINVNQTLINESNQNENLLNNLLVEINENEQILIAINSSINNIINDLDNIIKPQLNNISNKINGLNNSINEVLINISTLNANQQLVLGNLSEIIDLFNALDNNFSDLQSALTYINQTTISTNQKIDYLNNTLIIMNNTITKIDGNLIMMNATITKISNDVTELNITLNNISSKIDDLSLSLAFINDSIIDINKSVVIIDERLINLSELTNYSFNNLNSTLFDIKDIVLNINDSMINISDLIIELNNSMVNEHNNLTNLILSINGSLSSLINYDYEELVKLINDSNNNLTNLINSNTNYLAGLIINTNVSLQERFDAVDNNIQLLLNNISIINDKLDCEYNRSIVCEKLDNISSDLIIINSSLNTIYNYLNNTINNQLTNISSIVIDTNYYLKNNLTIMINQSFNNLSTLINVSHQDIINYLQELNLTINELANDILNDTNNILTQIALMNTTITQSNTTTIYKKLLALEQMIADNYYFDEELVFLITDSVDKAKNINNEKNLITIRDNVYEINKKLRNDDEKPNYLKKFPILIFSSIIAIIIFIMIREKRIENNEKNNNNY